MMGWVSKQLWFFIHCLAWHGYDANDWLNWWVVNCELIACIWSFNHICIDSPFYIFSLYSYYCSFTFSIKILGYFYQFLFVSLEMNHSALLLWLLYTAHSFIHSHHSSSLTSSLARLALPWPYVSSIDCKLLSIYLIWLPDCLLCLVILLNTHCYFPTYSYYAWYLVFFLLWHDFPSFII